MSNSETTTLKTYDPARIGHPMGPKASVIDELLLETVGAGFVTPDALARASGLGLASVGWRVFQLRCEGWVIEAALDDRAAFVSGARGWRLVDLVTEGEMLARQPVSRHQSLGRAVFHAEHGEGRVRFEREGFPMISVEFAHGVAKVSRDELLAA